MRLSHLLLILQISNYVFCVDEDLLTLHEKVKGLKLLGRDVWQINKTSYEKKRDPCDSFHDYVCEEGYYLHTVMMTTPKLDDLVALMNAIERDVPEGFKTLSSKAVNFFLSCGKVKSVDECHRESFEFFRPIYAYVIALKLSNKINRHDFVNMLEHFLTEASRLVNHGNIRKLRAIREQLLALSTHFSIENIDDTFKDLEMFAGNYEHNLRAIEKFQAENPRPWKHNNLVDFTLFLYESRNMPVSYFYATMNVHLWMSVFNSTDRERNFDASCFLMPQYLKKIDELRVMTFVYYHSFLKSWKQYVEYSMKEGKDIVAEENVHLKDFNIDNDKLFFIFYGQNFCQFGKEIADNVFYQAIKHRLDCPKGSFMNPDVECDFGFM